MVRKKKKQCDLGTKLYWNGPVTLGYPKCEETRIPAQVERVNFTINITCNCMCVSQGLSNSWVFFKCWYNIHIPLVLTFKKKRFKNGVRNAKSFYERGLTWMLPVKRAPLFLLLLIPTTIKSSPVVVTARLQSPWRCCLIAWNYPVSTYMYVTFNAVVLFQKSSAISCLG